MNIMLGNLGVQDIEKRVGITLADAERRFLMGLRQERAENVRPGKWHCFDMPFNMVCGDMETAQKVYNVLSSYSVQMSERLEISIVK